MAKIAKNALPDGHTREDFRAFGPVVTKDCEWGNARLCDLGCFKQETVDSNKYYHLAVVQSTKTNKWYAYFEWGRTKDGRPDKPSFQFAESSSEQEAVDTCKQQFNEKNAKRGMWEQIGSKQRFVSKPGKDAYIVRPTATRLVGLPCVENIANEDAKGIASTPVMPVNKATSTRKVDLPTKKLFKDLLGGAVKYANAVMSGGKGKATLPTQHAINEARTILDDAMVRIKVVGDNIQSQIVDRDLRQLTYGLYGLVPKTKPIGAAESAWLLTQENILAWRLDLDAFETALQANDIHIEEEETDVLQGIPADIHYIPESDDIYKWLVPWWTKSTRNKHGNVGLLKVHNLWAIERHGDKKIIRDAQKRTLEEMSPTWNKERPLHQIIDRLDLDANERKMFHNCNTALMFHGTRSVNVAGIVKENFRLPKNLVGVTVNGAALGGGVYQADDWKKSAGYCSAPGAYWVKGGAVQGRHSFMLLCDVCLGHPHVAPKCEGYTGPPKGYHSVFGKGNYTKTDWSPGVLMNNEWVVYSTDRVEIRYFAEISWTK